MNVFIIESKSDCYASRCWIPLFRGMTIYAGAKPDNCLQHHAGQRFAAVCDSSLQSVSYSGVVYASAEGPILGLSVTLRDTLCLLVVFLFWCRFSAMRLLWDILRNVLCLFVCTFVWFLWCFCVVGAFVALFVFTFFAHLFCPL